MSKKKQNSTESISYDRFKDFIEKSPLTDGPIRLTIPDNSLCKPDDRITWSMKSKNPCIKLLITKAKHIIYERYGKLKKKYEQIPAKKLTEKYGTYSAVNLAFFELKDELEEENKDPEKYDLKDEPTHFDKAYRDWRTKQNKKK